MTEKKTAQKKTTSKATKAKDAPKLEAVPAPKDAPAVIMFPPMILLFTLMVGIVLSWLFPMGFWFDLGSLGFVLFAVGMGGAIWCKKIFEGAGTNISPNDPTHTIITTGPFKYSRNPIYACFLIVFTGLSMMADSSIMLLLLAPLFYVLDQHVIKPEEEYLTEKFGADYTDYKDNTPRWVGSPRPKTR